MNRINFFNANNELQTLDSTLKEVLEKYKIKFSLTLFEDENTVWLNHIIIPKKDRCKGIGSKVLSLFCEFLDKHNWSCKLLVANCFGVEEDALVKIYSKFGFVIYDEQKPGIYMIRKGDKNGI